MTHPPHVFDADADADADADNFNRLVPENAHKDPALSESLH